MTMCLQVCGQILTKKTYLYRLPVPVPQNKLFKLKLRHLFSLRSTQSYKPCHSKDKVSQKFDLIYENSLKYFIVPCRLISTAASITTMGLAAYHGVQNHNSLQQWEKYTLAGLCCFSVLSILLVNKLTSYYITRIYYNQETDTFIGIIHSFFGTSRQLKYCSLDLKNMKLPLKKSSIHLQSNFNANGKTYFVKANDFVMPKYYNWHLGQT
ncbi:uncharacterized protein LOC106062105 [Biomphalaria glabrata]|uniref:Uncharacterized protein LOC106062105 n=1 Tax=Biomphalaria glabrata TaxID=6526 RepID=A0A9U8E740_BIOGL|nr:uncharacterized protein LOC106062105 [Biomphalaria glabrata]